MLKSYKRYAEEPKLELRNSQRQLDSIAGIWKGVRLFEDAA